MRIGRVLLATTVLAGHQLACQWRDRAGAREDLVEDGRTDAQARAGSTRVGVVEAVRPPSLDGGAGFEVVGPAQAVLAATSAASRTSGAPRVTS